MAVNITYHQDTDVLDMFVSDVPPRQPAAVNDVLSFKVREASRTDHELLGFHITNLSGIVAGSAAASLTTVYMPINDTLQVFGSGRPGTWQMEAEEFNGRRIDIHWDDESHEMTGMRLHGVSSLLPAGLPGR